MSQPNPEKAPHPSQAATPQPEESSPSQGGIAGLAAAAAGKASEIARAGGEAIVNAGDHLKAWSEKQHSPEAGGKEGEHKSAETTAHSIDKRDLTPGQTDSKNGGGGLGGLAAATTEKAGDIARAGGEAVANAGDHLKEWNHKHQVTDKTGAAVSKAGETLDKGREWVAHKIDPGTNKQETTKPSEQPPFTG